MTSEDRIVRERAGFQPGSPSGLFLHTSWRSAGTWVWSRFRELPQVEGFYEPFHSVLARDKATLGAIHADSWASGHPALERPYFHEYLPLVRSRKFFPPRKGVKGFKVGFELDRFGPEPWPGARSLKAYLDRLLKTARKSRRIGVFKFCRSMGRLTWLMDTFPQVAHVVVLRSPASQWSSYWGQWKKYGNPWFMMAPYRVLGNNLETPLVRRAAQSLGCDLDALNRLAMETESIALDSIQKIPIEASYRVHLAHWTLSLMSLNERLDAIIDSDKLSYSSSYAQECAELLTRITGLHPDFSDAHPTDTGKFLCTLAGGPGADPLEGMDPDGATMAHQSAVAFASRELGPDKSFALKLIRSKLSQATEQILTGELARLDPAEGDSTRPRPLLAGRRGWLLNISRSCLRGSGRS